MDADVKIGAGRLELIKIEGVTNFHGYYPYKPVTP
jgi:hypothetical protein